MSNLDHDRELHAEREYIAELYVQLDTQRRRARAEFSSALRTTGHGMMHRDDKVRASGREMKRLDLADNGLCFGRLDTEAGQRIHIGRIGLFDTDNDYEPLLVDWRAPAAQAFYTATAAHPENMRRRRQLHTRGRQVLDYTDEILGRPDSTATGDEALLAAVNAPRGAGMRDIVATIQAEQDAIVRLDHQGVVVIEGGPGTGKTAVALHRVAYLLYTQRERMQRHGVLIVGPNPELLTYIGRVLPSLGESDVVFMSTGDFMPGMRPTVDDTAEIARLKGSLDMVGVLQAAIADRRWVPEEPIEVKLRGSIGRIDAPLVHWAHQEAHDSAMAHNQARAVFTEIITYVLTERAMKIVAAGLLDRSDKKAWEQFRSGLVTELHNDDHFNTTLDQLWPIVSPQQLLSTLYSTPQRLTAAGADPALYREDGAAWTISDTALLDELAELLGPHDDADDSAERELNAQKAYAAQVLDLLHVDRHTDLMDDEDHLMAQDLLYAEDLAQRFTEQDTRELVERATADREWTYRHVVVDEAQELSDMQWRVLMRRCPGKSFTIVGDLAQRRSAAGATTWASVLEPYVEDRWLYRQLHTNYRTPSEIMAVAADILTEFAPHVHAPESVRSTGIRPWARQVADSAELSAAIDRFHATEAELEGTCVVIGPADVEAAVVAAATKGLEFDSVLIVEPERILDTGPRGHADLYVALTRATQRLGVLHRRALPESLSRLSTEGSS